MSSDDQRNIEPELDETAVDLDALDDTGADATGVDSAGPDSAGLNSGGLDSGGLSASGAGSIGLASDEDAPNRSPTQRHAPSRPGAVHAQAAADDLTADQVLVGMDPERDSSDVAIQRSVTRQVASEGGQFVLGSVILVLAIGVCILALTTQDRAYIIIACVAAPPAGLFFFLRWKRWLGQAPYLYRLLTSLGENADDVLKAHQNKQELRSEQARQKAELKAAKILNKHRRP